MVLELTNGLPMAARDLQGRVYKTMKKNICLSILTIGLFGVFALLAPTSNAQQAADPLAQFRTNNAPNSNVGQAQRMQAQPRQPVQQQALPSPTVGGLQQGPSQADIDSALAGYDFDFDADIEAQKAEIERQARDAAFEAALNGMFPMRTEEILEFLERFRETREASESRIGGVPTPEITLETVSLDPGAVPPVIKLSPGHVTTLNVLDVTGQPWPIRDISWGGDFDVIQPQEGEHVVRISPLKAHEVGNISMQLLDLKTPVTFRLQTQLEVVQYRFDARIPEYGPYADVPIIDNGITLSAGDGDITRVLDGTPPPQAKRLGIDGVDGRTTAFEVGGQVYVRTPLTLLSPGWSSSVTSADGTTVYAIGQSPVLLLSDRGKMVRAMVEYN
jgi:intracellular multiplication protein IcmK